MELPGGTENARNNARCLDGQHQNVDTGPGLPMEESVRMTREDRDKLRKYVNGVANPRFEDG